MGSRASRSGELHSRRPGSPGGRGIGGSRRSSRKFSTTGRAKGTAPAPKPTPDPNSSVARISSRTSGLTGQERRAASSRAISGVMSTQLIQPVSTPSTGQNCNPFATQPVGTAWYTAEPALGQPADSQRFWTRRHWLGWGRWDSGSCDRKIVGVQVPPRPLASFRGILGERGRDTLKAITLPLRMPSSRVDDPTRAPARIDSGFGRRTEHQLLRNRTDRRKYSNEHMPTLLPGWHQKTRGSEPV
jgi:hypothetical protein